MNLISLKTFIFELQTLYCMWHILPTRRTILQNPFICLCSGKFVHRGPYVSAYYKSFLWNKFTIMKWHKF